MCKDSSAIYHYLNLPVLIYTVIAWMEQQGSVDLMLFLFHFPFKFGFFPSRRIGLMCVCICKHSRLGVKGKRVERDKHTFTTAKSVYTF
jgi:hypothetical protein